jgi:hypothetical protein
MEAEYTLALDDVLAWNRYYLDHSPTIRHSLRRRIVYQALGAIVGCLAVSAILPSLWWLWGIFIVLCVAIFSVFAFAYPNSTRRTNTRLIERMYEEGKNASLYRRRRLTIAPETITEATDISVTTYKWSAIEKIVIDQQHAYFLVSALGAFVLPKRACATDEAFQRYVELAQQYYQESAEPCGQSPALAG